MIILDKDTAVVAMPQALDNERLPKIPGNFSCGRLDTPWYVVLSKPGMQHVADRELRVGGFPTFFPVYGARRAAYVPMFGRYGFAQPNDEGQWVGMLHTFGVAGVLRHLPLGPPKVVPAGVMTALFKQCSPNGVIFETAPKRLIKGQVGKIMEGPFAGFTAICQWTSEERIGMLLSIMGQRQTLKFKHAAVEPMAIGVSQ